jgi:hypothetical protein
MSYDVDIGDRSFNITYNIAPLLYDHIPAVDAQGGLSEIDGKTGAQALVILSEAFDRLDETRHKLWQSGFVGEPKFCAKYDVPNGWGSTVGAIVFLSRVMAACALNGRKRVRVS